jgi:hypothetical protein
MDPIRASKTWLNKSRRNAEAIKGKATNTNARTMRHIHRLPVSTMAKSLL